jgi:DNA-binding Lrp family transcriptional regulator
VSHRVVIAEEQLRCWQLSLAGHAYRQIAEELGISLATVSRRINGYLKDRVQPEIDALVATEIDRFDRYLVKLDEQIQAGKAVARNVEVAVKVSESRRKLLGIDAPTQIEATVHQVDSTDLAIAELIREAQAAAAAEEAKLREGTI